MLLVLSEDMVMPINAKIADVRIEFKRLNESEVWLKNIAKLANGRERHTFTLKGEPISHTYDVDDTAGRVLHVFQAGSMFTTECARFKPKAK